MRCEIYPSTVASTVAWTGLLHVTYCPCMNIECKIPLLMSVDVAVHPLTSCIVILSADFKLLQTDCEEVSRTPDCYRRIFILRGILASEKSRLSVDAESD